MLALLYQAGEGIPDLQWLINAGVAVCILVLAVQWYLRVKDPQIRADSKEATAQIIKQYSDEVTRLVTQASSDRAEFKEQLNMERQDAEAERDRLLQLWREERDLINSRHAENIDKIMSVHAGALERVGMAVDAARNQTLVLQQEMQALQREVRAVVERLPAKAGNGYTPNKP